MRKLEWPYYLARTLVEHAEWLASVGRRAEAGPLLAEAETLLTPLRASVWLERIERARAGAGAAVA